MSNKHVSKLSDSELRAIAMYLPKPYIDYILKNKDKPFEVKKAYTEGFREGASYILEIMERTLSKMRV